MGGAVFLHYWLSGLRHHCTGVSGLWVGTRSWLQNVGLQDRLCQWVLPSMSTTSVFVPEVIHSHPLCLQKTLWDLQAGLARLFWSRCSFPWAPPSVLETCVCPPVVVFPFPSILWGSCDQTPSKLNALGASPGAIPTNWGAWPGVQDSPVGEPLRYNYFPVCGSGICLYHVCTSYNLVASLLLRVEYLFFFFIMSMVVQQLVVNLVFLWEEVSSGPCTLPSCLGTLLLGPQSIGMCTPPHLSGSCFPSASCCRRHCWLPLEAGTGWAQGSVAMSTVLWTSFSNPSYVNEDLSFIEV